jgi:uncharacterized protein YgiM (DUF1202 family)
MMGVAVRSAILTVGLVVASASAASAAEYAVEVTSYALNVRTQAWGTIIGVADQGDRFVAHASSNGWVAIDFSGREAWISAAYVRRVPNDAVRINADALNVRNGPGAGNAAFAMVARGQLYTSYGTSGDWTRIQVDGRTGWVASWLVTPVSLSGRQPILGIATPPPSSTSYGLSVTAEELEILARICKGEARQCTFEGKVAVVAVVLNRVRAPGFPGTIKGVAHQPYQFSCYNANVRNQLYWGPIPQSCWDAARAAVAGQDPSRGATYYFNPYLVKPSWARNMRFLVRIGVNGAMDTHDFYRP